MKGSFIQSICVSNEGSEFLVSIEEETTFEKSTSVKIEDCQSKEVIIISRDMVPSIISAISTLENIIKWNQQGLESNKVDIFDKLKEAVVSCSPTDTEFVEESLYAEEFEKCYQEWKKFSNHLNPDTIPKGVASTDLLNNFLPKGIKISENCGWLAMDEDGEVYAFSSKPHVYHIDPEDGASFWDGCIGEFVWDTKVCPLPVLNITKDCNWTETLTVLI